MYVKLVAVLCVSFVVGCKVQIEAPLDGHVSSVSGAHHCAAGQTCSIDVSDVYFQESFVAVPNNGMRFLHWKKRPRGFFGNSGNPEARLVTGGFAGNESLLSLLDSDETFYLEPVFGRLLTPAPATLGGSPSSPSELNLNSWNEIQVNSFHNHFKFSAKQNQLLMLRVDLAIPLSVSQKGLCSSNPGTGSRPSSYDTQIHVYSSRLDRVDGICGEELMLRFEEDGELVLNFEYPSHGGGRVYAQELPGEVNFANPQGVAGSPGAPRPLLTGVRNPTSSNPFFNYYRVTASKGDRIIVNAVLDQPLSTRQKTSCSANATLDTQIRVYNSKFERIDSVCGERLSFDFSEDGTFIIQIAYGAQSAGYFEAALIR